MLGRPPAGTGTPPTPIACGADSAGGRRPYVAACSAIRDAAFSVPLPIGAAAIIIIIMIIIVRGSDGHGTRRLQYRSTRK